MYNLVSVAWKNLFTSSDSFSLFSTVKLLTASIVQVCAVAKSTFFFVLHMHNYWPQDFIFDMHFLLWYPMIVVE